MIGLVLVTHAGLATALKLSAEMIAGPIEQCATVEVAPDNEPMISWPALWPLLKRLNPEGQ